MLLTLFIMAEPQNGLLLTYLLSIMFIGLLCLWDWDETVKVGSSWRQTDFGHWPYFDKIHVVSWRLWTDPVSHLILFDL